jgi:hypothetical protein
MYMKEIRLTIYLVGTLPALVEYQSGDGLRFAEDIDIFIQ